MQGIALLLQLLLLLQGSFIVLVAQKSKVPAALEETYDQSFRPYNFNGTWKTDNGILYSDNYTGDVYLFDVRTNKSRLLLDSSLMSDYTNPTVVFSYDNSLVLIGYDYVKGFRYSMYQRFDVYDIASRSFTRISNGERLHLAKWSPVENALVYVRENDIYYKVFSDTGSIERRLTYTGIPGVVFNGIPDWVYEEEVLASPWAMWFSPDGKHLAFVTFNDTNVKEIVIPKYGTPGSIENQYPSEQKIKYPKAGSPNPVVSLTLVDLTDPSSELINLQPPIDTVGVDNIIYTVNWRNKEQVVATWTNRVQNKAVLVLYDTQGKASHIHYEEETEGWVRVHPPLYHNEYVIILKPQDIGTQAGRFLHPTRYVYNNGILTDEKDLTPKSGEVNGMLAIDHIKGRLYYLATVQDTPSQRHLYSVQIDGTGEPICVSCTQFSPEGNLCRYAYAYFSTSASNYALSCSGPDPLTVRIFNANHKFLYPWEENRYLRGKLARRLRPIVKMLVAKGETRVKLVLPADFDESKSYPLLINVYAGPNTAKYTDEFSYGFEAYMATNRSVVYGYIDGRGSANKGSKMLHAVYRRLGTAEIDDQIEVTETLLAAYPWLDGNKTAIWGWSYGGFATAMVMATDEQSVFKCGISVAPVTSWIYYDSIYTERFMGLPTLEDNQEGYFNYSDVTKKVEGMRGKKYMLIHGTGDDNVHYQQSMALAKVLEEKDIMFEQQSYPDQAHALASVTPHLYHTIDRFLSKCLGYSSNRRR
ncbi:venom dipeptidyl peptidase 4 isoform X2 [Osmia lignaria lignaria]|uniref:venom dipeptidyl peptidase 4 isoform X2 n=2 Tax=Osmia lignaria lignaria TaxID=1437193 RepID=UPI00402B59F7